MTSFPFRGRRSRESRFDVIIAKPFSRQLKCLMKSRFSFVVSVLLFLLAARADGPEDQYLRIYSLMQEADAVLDTSSTRIAMEKYNEALNALKKFKAVYPNWNEKVVSYRLTYIETKLSRLT